MAPLTGDPTNVHDGGNPIDAKLWIDLQNKWNRTVKTSSRITAVPCQACRINDSEHADLCRPCFILTRIAVQMFESGAYGQGPYGGHPAREIILDALTPGVRPGP